MSHKHSHIHIHTCLIRYFALFEHTNGITIYALARSLVRAHINTHIQSMRTKPLRSVVFNSSINGQYWFILDGIFDSCGCKNAKSNKMYEKKNLYDFFLSRWNTTQTVNNSNDKKKTNRNNNYLRQLWINSIWKCSIHNKSHNLTWKMMLGEIYKSQKFQFLFGLKTIFMILCIYFHNKQQQHKRKQKQQ